MKRPFLLVCMLLISILLTLDGNTISCGLDPLNGSNLLVISGMKEVYSVQEPIDFVVNNNTNKTLFFSCPVEKKIDGNWREIISSIDAKDFAKKTRIWELAPKKLFKLSWNRKEQQTFSPLVATGVFRFKFEIMAKPGRELIGKMFSNEFEVDATEKKK